jgi:very-short-patch-repair endonuclease
MPVRNIVIGQKVDPEKTQRAKELRRLMTPEENLLWQGLRTNQLGGYHFRRQQVIDGYIVDFYCHVARLIIELDGEIHSDQVEDDQERDHVLTSRGFRILRVKNDEVKQNLPKVLSRILKLCSD